MTERIIHWFRRDLRIHDNTALHKAVTSGIPVIPLFIIDDTLLQSPRVGAPRVKFMLQALRSLDKTLQLYGAKLIIRRGKPLNVLQQFSTETGVTALYFNADYSPYAQHRDNAVTKSLKINVHSYDDALLLPPGSVMTKSGDPYKVFTPFKRVWNEKEKPAIIKTAFSRAMFDAHLGEIYSERIPSPDDLGFAATVDIPEASEAQAHHLLDAFISEDIAHYDETRNTLVISPFDKNRPKGTSYLSPYLRLGLLSPRQSYWAARNAYHQTNSQAHQNAIATWVSELTWREFYMHILYFYPHVMQRDFVETYQSLAWEEDPHGLQAWKDGMTGYPIIDAPMRQLKAIGWMPNRARMIVASFLTKDLLIYWKHGDIHFMQHLIDGDPAANNGGWQWAAGTGTDAQPYFRIFNPVSQSEKFATPDYLRSWLPELKNVPDDMLHTPWKMEKAPDDYPAPIVDHQKARERTLAAFKAARGE